MSVGNVKPKLEISVSVQEIYRHSLTEHLMLLLGFIKINNILKHFCGEKLGLSNTVIYLFNTVACLFPIFIFAGERVNKIKV